MEQADAAGCGRLAGSSTIISQTGHGRNACRVAAHPLGRGSKNVLVDEQENLTVLNWDWRLGNARFDISWAITFRWRSSFNDFSAALATEYAY